MYIISNDSGMQGLKETESVTRTQFIIHIKCQNYINLIIGYTFFLLFLNRKINQSEVHAILDSLLIIFK